MANKLLPTPVQLRQLLHCELETGMMFWKERGIEWFTDGKHSAMHTMNAWNGRHATKPAINIPHGNGYLSGVILKQRLFAHRVVWAIANGEYANQIDHINHNRADNRLINLRQVDTQENMKNSSLSGSNTSGYVGVFWDKRRALWRAEVKANGRTVFLGRFSRKDDAIAARAEANVKYGFHENHGMKYEN